MGNEKASKTVTQRRGDERMVTAVSVRLRMEDDIRYRIRGGRRRHPRSLRRAPALEAEYELQRARGEVDRSCVRALPFGVFFVLPKTK